MTAFKWSVALHVFLTRYPVQEGHRSWALHRTMCKKGTGKQAETEEEDLPGFYQYLWSSSSKHSQYTNGWLCCPSDWSLVPVFHYHHSHLVTQYALWARCALDMWDYEHIVLGQQAMGSLIPEKHKLPSLLIILLNLSCHNFCICKTL